MDTARADALAARDFLAGRGWIRPRNESFRHLPPPGVDTWLGIGSAAPPPLCEAVPWTGTGWTLQPVGNTPLGRTEARWLDAADPMQRAALFAGLPPPGEGDAAPFAWAHRALCCQGLRVRVTGTADTTAPPTVWLQLRHQPRASVEAPLLVLEVADGVRCVLIETHERVLSQAEHSVAQNLHLHLRLGRGAALQHLRVVTPGSGDHIAHFVHAQLAQDARYAQALVASGSAYHLQRSVLDLQGAGAVARTAGLLLAADSALEQQVQMAHTGARTHSAVEALALVRGKARAVVNAHTRIAPGADQAEVRQRLHGIPLAGQPRLVLRPHLEIHHDNVQAAHGATWGALPQDALFYARQRGLDEDGARSLIVQGMASALLERCFDDAATTQTLLAHGLLERTLAQHLDNAPEVHHG